jgi:hypothetical protein
MSKKFGSLTLHPPGYTPQFIRHFQKTIKIKRENPILLEKLTP